MTKADFKAIMLHHLGIPYIYGGKNVLVGEDCSGFTCEMLKALGALGTNDEFGSQQLHDKFLSFKSDIRDTGTLVFYGADDQHIDHVAVFLDDTFIVEAGHGTADTTTKEIAAQRGAYIRVRPYTYRKDFVCTVTLNLGLTA